MLSKTLDFNNLVENSANKQESLNDDSVLEGTKVQLFNSEMRPLKHLYKLSSRDKPMRKSIGAKNS